MRFQIQPGQCETGLTLHLYPLTSFFVLLDTGMLGFEEFVCTDSVDYVTDDSPLYGLDCEMVRCSPLLINKTN